MFEAGSKSSIVALKSVADEANPTQSSASTSPATNPLNNSKSSIISTGAIVGIVITAIAAIAIGAALFWLRKRKLWFFASKPNELAVGHGNAPSDPNPVLLECSGKEHELSAYSSLTHSASEIAGTDLVEMEDHTVARHYSKEGLYEMHGSTPIAAELASPPERYEMFDSSVYREIQNTACPQEHTPFERTKISLGKSMSRSTGTPLSAVSTKTLPGYIGPVPLREDEFDVSP